MKASIVLIAWSEQACVFVHVHACMCVQCKDGLLFHLLFSLPCSCSMFPEGVNLFVYLSAGEVTLAESHYQVLCLSAQVGKIEPPQFQATLGKDQSLGESSSTCNSQFHDLNPRPVARLSPVFHSFGKQHLTLVHLPITFCHSSPMLFSLLGVTGATQQAQKQLMTSAELGNEKSVYLVQSPYISWGHSLGGSSALALFRRTNQ